MAISYNFKSISIDNELVKQVNIRRIEKVNYHSKIKKILSNLNYYNVLGVVYSGSKNPTDIAKSIGVNPKNINVILSKLSGNVVLKGITLNFLTKTEISHKNVVYDINYRGILKFIAKELLGVPFIFKRGVPDPIFSNFKKSFILLLKSYTLYEFFNMFIFKYSNRYENIHSNLFLSPFGFGFEDSIAKLKKEEYIKKYEKEFSKEDLFIISCYAYVLEKLIID